jgi:hypothetical protein
MDSHRPGVTYFVHVGLVVEDLDETVRFLALLGFDCGEPGVFSGEFERGGAQWPGAGGRICIEDLSAPVGQHRASFRRATNPSRAGRDPSKGMSVERAAHLPALEQPAAVADILVRFLDRHATS